MEKLLSTLTATSLLVQGAISQPLGVARVLDDGSTQLYQFVRNAVGKPLQITDPTNRVTLYAYSNDGIDLLAISQLVGTNKQAKTYYPATNLLAGYTYNSQHLPLTAKDAAGHTTKFGCNSYGQMTGMQAETKSPAAPGVTEADNSLAILARILSSRINDMHMLGGSERPTTFLLHLALTRGFVVDLDSEGRILAIRWSADENGLASCDFVENFPGMPLPLLLMRRTAKEVLLSDRAAFLMGNNGITVKNAEGDLEFIPAEELIGLAYRPAEKPSQSQ
jgi:YD repeat-containing protein